MVNSNLLKTVRFVDTHQWNVKHFFATTISSKYSLEEIGKHTVHITEKTKLFENPEKEYAILGISNEIGMFDAYTELGKNINQPYIYVEDGCLAYNPYRVNVGSIGLKTPLLKNEYISPAYVVFKCKETILPEYLYLILKSSAFNKIIQENTTGSVRQTLSYDNLSTIKIPIPSTIDEQRKLVAIYNSLINESIKKNQEIAQLEKSIDEYFLNILGVRVEDIQKNNGSLIRQINYSLLSRWDVWSQTTQYTSFKYSFSKFGSVVKGKPMYGANCKGIKKKTDVRYIRITDINEDGSLNDDFVSAEAVDEKYILEENDFLIARSGNTVGKTFLYKPNMGQCIFAGYLVKYILNSKAVIPEYLLYYTKSSIFKSWIQNNQRIFGQPNINGQEYLNADIIVPELEVQKEIVKTVESKRIQIDIKKKESKKLILLAQCQFEEAVFGEA